MFFSDTLSKEAVIPVSFPCSEIAVTLTAFHPEDAVNYQTAISIFKYKIVCHSQNCVLDSFFDRVNNIAHHCQSLQRSIFSLFEYSWYSYWLLEYPQWYQQ